MLSPKDPLEIVNVTFDFSKVTSGIQTASLSIVRIDGQADSNPTAMLSGSPSISGAKVVQKITGGVNGTSYKLYCLADTVDGERFREEAFIQVVSE